MTAPLRARLLATIEQAGFVTVSALKPTMARRRQLLEELRREGLCTLVAPTQGSYLTYSKANKP